MANLLAHSGAVILIQNHNYEYHFSSRIQPWVHYVPLKYNAADLIEKVEWLENHGKLAYRIARNARAFGASHLRLEDYFCYNAKLMKTFASIMNDTDTVIPFHPKRMNTLPVDSKD